MVDQNGTIWRGDHPVGYWGVNGGENPKVNRGTQRSGGAER
jgi:hypothetical protein